MNIRQSVFGEIAIRSGTVVLGIELGSLLRRLLLFDTVIVRSVRLREVPFLVRVLGRTGFVTLLKSGVLKLVCEWTGIVTDPQTNGVPNLPWCHFSFGICNIAHRDDVLRSELISLQGVPGLGNVERAAMEETILTRLVRPKPEYGNQLLAQLESDLRNNAPVLKETISEQLTAQLGVSRPFAVTVEETGNRIFRIASDLPKQFDLSEERTHNIVKSAICAVGQIDQRIADMEAYSAITGFTEEEAPLLFGKLAGIISPQNPDRVEKQFMRVIAIAGLPDVQNRRIDVEQLLKVRESVECREFRAWLSGSLESSDEQIAEMVKGVRNKVGTVLHGNVGKVMKFAAITAVGLIPGATGLVAGPVASALDAFLTDKVFPNSGALAFLATTYPSLFVPL